MTGLKTTRANAILDSEMTGTRQLRLYTTAPTSTTDGVEKTAAQGYVPQTITFAAATGGQKTQNNSVVFPTATGNYPLPIVAWAITDTSGVQYTYRAVPAFTPVTGDITSYPSGTVILTLG